jgi:hypothetical protein
MSAVEFIERKVEGKKCKIPKLLDTSYVTLPTEVEHECFKCKRNGDDPDIKFDVKKWTPAHNRYCRIAHGKCHRCGGGVSRIVSLFKLYVAQKGEEAIINEELSDSESESDLDASSAEEEEAPALVELEVLEEEQQQDIPQLEGDEIVEISLQSQELSA